MCWCHVPCKDAGWDPSHRPKNDVIIWARTILLRSSHSLHMTASNPPKTAGKGAYICSAAWLRTCHGNAKGVIWHLLSVSFSMLKLTGTTANKIW